MAGVRSTLAEGRGLLRQALRLAKQHDETPQLKALLPLHNPAAELPLSAPNAPPLEHIVHEWARSYEHGTSDANASLRAFNRLLSANLDRKERMQAEGGSTANTGTGLSSDIWVSPNHSYYQRRLERARTALTSASPPEDADTAAINLTPYQVLKEMERLQLKPIPRGFFLSAIQAPAACERSDILPCLFEDSLRSFWMMELSTPLKPCSSIASSLVAGALANVGSQRAGKLLDSELEPRNAAKWRAVHIHNALSSAGVTVDRKTSNFLLRTASELAQDQQSAGEVASLLRNVRESGVAVLEPALQSLLYAAYRAESYELARTVLQASKNQGYSLPAELVNELSQWLAQSQRKEDHECAERLQNELHSSGKLAWMERFGNRL